MEKVNDVKLKKEQKIMAKKYIDADILQVKITDLCANANFYQQKAMEESNREDFVSSGGEIFAYTKVLSLIDSLQQEPTEGISSNVNLEKEYKKYVEDVPAFRRLNRYVGLAIARHFYELGLNTRK